MEKQKIEIFTFEKYTLAKIITGVFKENCYIVVDRESSDAIIFDPGEDDDLIFSQVQELDCNVKCILLTHGHFDHVGKVASLIRKYNVGAFVHKNDQRLMRQAPLYAIRYINKVVEAPLPFGVFENETSLTFGSITVNIFRTPGHTSGGVSFQIDRIVITGDTLFKEHIGPTNYPESNLNDLLESVDSLLSNLDENATIYPGHGREWSVKNAKVWWNAKSVNKPQYQIMNDPTLK
ncbi:beta-lactamase protein [Leptospira ryugenii]|uniref:Beta-lactamase protein n=1 Tax=Leptospira ryugenii TaxID=1917863 RepID=A0A2P2DW29_9LEPT|nr:MBL fold metallo-hydrolase [Leptospira ryugenii]GBF48842.1 beta-lactamase protein [Leptospira ryugenii]